MYFFFVEAFQFVWLELTDESQNIWRSAERRLGYRDSEEAREDLLVACPIEEREKWDYLDDFPKKKKRQDWG